jgi:hypothetical protein
MLRCHLEVPVYIDVKSIPSNQYGQCVVEGRARVSVVQLSRPLKQTVPPPRKPTYMYPPKAVVRRLVGPSSAVFRPSAAVVVQPLGCCPQRLAPSCPAI